MIWNAPGLSASFTTQRCFLCVYYVDMGSQSTKPFVKPNQGVGTLSMNVLVFPTDIGLKRLQFYKGPSIIYCWGREVWLFLLKNELIPYHFVIKYRIPRWSLWKLEGIPLIHELLLTFLTPPNIIVSPFRTLKYENIMNMLLKNCCLKQFCKILMTSNVLSTN